jgi:DNA-binding PadR family transcriptional regulator
MAKTKPTGKRVLDACPCSGLHLDKFVQAAMLSALASEPSHGYRIVQRLRQMPMFHNRAPDLTGVYRLLKAMEGRKLVVCAWDTSATGPAKKQFRITQRGLDCLGRWIRTIEDYSTDLRQLLAALKGTPLRRPRPFDPVGS